MSWFIGSVVLALLAAWAYWELRVAGRTPERDAAGDGSADCAGPAT